MSCGHKPEAIAIADHVVDLGPSAGSGIDGGEVVFEGTVEGLRARRHADRATSRRSSRPQGDGADAHWHAFEVRGAAAHNLRDVNVEHPPRSTGRRHRGRRLRQELARARVDPRRPGRGVSRPGRDPRLATERSSNPGTYTGLLDPEIRNAFAKTNGVKPALFSANSDGACPNCNGAGVIYTDLAMMAGVATVCEVCDGKRFQAEVLEYTFGGKDIGQVLAMSVTEAGELFGAGDAKTPAAHRILAHLADVGLGYLGLGQPLTTLSGGERQRLKLATHMAEKGDVYVLDEPTSPACTSPTRSSDCSACSTDSSTPARRTSSSRTTRRPPGGHGTPTGSSISVPALATMAAGSSSRHSRRPRRRALHPHRRTSCDLRRHLTSSPYGRSRRCLPGSGGQLIRIQELRRPGDLYASNGGRTIWVARTITR
ncbi:MAG: ATP-binding cassette domain-containing protein [Candidatus Limnocylindrales bacterium]